jgi:hypothetical protein
MVLTRHDEVWKRRGLTLLWGLESLVKVALASQVVSIRQFFAMQDLWPEDLPALNGDTIVVSGLEGCLEVLSETEAEAWIENDLKKVILSFQDEFEGQAGLIFWLPSGRNLISMTAAREEYFWKHRATKTDRGLPIGRLLWAGAEKEVERILNTDDGKADYDGKAWVGIYHPRIG